MLPYTNIKIKPKYHKKHTKMKTKKYLADFPDKP